MKFYDRERELIRIKDESDKSAHRSSIIVLAEEDGSKFVL